MERGLVTQISAATNDELRKRLQGLLNQAIRRERRRMPGAKEEVKRLRARLAEIEERQRS
jgi:hypothetical protein